MSLDLEELEPLTRTDFRRANGAPQIVDRDGKNQRYSRPSSYAKPLDDESALVSWKIDRACIGVASDRALQARWIAIDPTDEDSRKAKGDLREASIAGGRGAEAADIGTALHAMSVRWEQDKTFSPPQPYLQSLEAYDKAMTTLGLRSTRFEFALVNERFRAAGTADRLYELTIPVRAPNGELLPPGTLLIGDLKTGSKLEYSMAGYSVQMCLYADSSFYDVVTDEFIDTPPINRDWAILVHMPASEPGVCEMLMVDLEVGRWGCDLVSQIKEWRRSWKSGRFSMPPVECDYETRELLDEPPTDVLGDPENLSAEGVVPSAGETTDFGLAEYTAWFIERLKQIAENPDAKKRLTLLWPVATPTPKQGIEMRHVIRIQELLSKIEAEFGLGFVPGGPPLKGHHSTFNQQRKEHQDAIGTE